MKKALWIVGTVILLIFSLLVYGIYWAFYDIQRLEGHDVIEEVSSPNGTYTIKAYLNNDGATTGYAVLCSVKNNITGKEKNIYWQNSCIKADIIWLNEDTVKINGVELNVKRDTYDYRHD